MAILELRPFQLQCVERAVASNTIVSLPTGKGKTIVAVKVVDFFLQRYVDKHVLFLVPTKALVSQQAAYCETHCAQAPSVAKLSGMEMDGWDEMQWGSCLKKFRILVGTPEIFRRALDRSFLDPRNLSLIVFDECHNAVGNHPMAAIMHDFVSKLDADRCPHILGLTASFYAGSLKRKKDAEKARVELELLLKASIFSPILEEGNLDDNVEHVQNKWEHIVWEPNNHAADFPNEVLGPLSGVFQKLGDVAKVKELNKMANRMHHVFEELGKAAMLFYVKVCIVRQLERQIEELLSSKRLPEAEQNDCAALLQKLPELNLLLEGLAKCLPKLPCVVRAPNLSTKFMALHELLRRDTLKGGKGIIFVEQVCITVPLAHVVNEHVKRQTEAIFGQMAKQDTEAIIKRFRAGETQILVSTTALEEGIDVCDCDWVVRFNKFCTTKNHIQGSGRARSNIARIYYFENDPSEEQSKAEVLSKVAKNESLALSDQERKNLEDARRPSFNAVGIYPFDADGQPIHIFNCLEIVYDWCQQVLGSAFDSESLYKTMDGKLCISYPAPEGFVSTTSESIDNAWSGVSLQSVVQKERLASLQKSEQEKRRALFVVAVRMRKEGLIDCRNIPNTKRVILAKAKCPMEKKVKTLSITGSFGRSDAHVRSGNYKNALQEMVQQRWKSLSLPLILAYESTMSDDGWTSVVRILPLEQSFTSEAFANKKAAEQDAAKKACIECTALRPIGGE